MRRRVSTPLPSTEASSVADAHWITRPEILEMFQGLMPGATVDEVDHDEYIASAKRHPFIRQQIEIGIYDENIGEEFLSVARTFADAKIVEVDTYLIESHMRGVDLVAAFGYVASVALHEYHHMIHHGGPQVSVAEQMQREVECDEYLHKNHGEVMEAAASAERQSITIQRVYSRMAALALRP